MCGSAEVDAARAPKRGRVDNGAAAPAAKRGRSQAPGAAEPAGPGGSAIADAAGGSGGGGGDAVRFEVRTGLLNRLSVFGMQARRAAQQASSASVQAT